MEENTVKFDVKHALLTNIKLMVGSSFTLDYGQLNAITPPTQVFLGSEYTLRFVWPRPPETGNTSSQNADEQFPRTIGPLWISATSDYDLDRVELKSVRDSMGAGILVNGLILIERPPNDVKISIHDDENAEESPERYLIFWGLKPSAHQLYVSHGEEHAESAWCHVAACEDVLEPSLAPLVDDLLKLDLAGILTRAQASLQLTTDSLKDNWTIIQSVSGSVTEITAQICCLDFFGQETLQLRIESSHAAE